MQYNISYYCIYIFYCSTIFPKTNQ